MNLNELEIDGFGVWNGLKLDRLSPGINVIYGPNEAGKSTLLQFIRAMLYGFTAERRRRYLPPVHSGRPGGTLEISADGDTYRLERRPRQDDSRHDELTLSTPGGRQLDADHLPRLLNHLDEPIFHNVFAVGLTEMQELGTLTDTEAARMLYDLTTGLERVSLGEVVRELGASRRRLLSPDGHTGELRGLLSERQRLQDEIQHSGSLTRDFSRWNREHEQLERDLRGWEQERAELEKTVHTLEAVAGMRGRWQERVALDEQLAALSASRLLPEDAVDRYDFLGRRIAKRRQRIAAARQKRRALRTEARGWRINDAALEHADRIATVADQHDAALIHDKQARDLDAEIADMELQLLAEPVRPAPLELEPVSLISSDHRTLDPSVVARLRAQAEALEQARERAEDAKREALRLQEEPEPAARQRPPVVKEHSVDEEETLESAGTLVTQLRRRLQLEQRLEGLNRQEVELEARCNELIDNQLLPVGVLAGLGALFVVGVILLLAGMFLPAAVTGSSGVALALLGIGGTVIAAVAKHKLEHVAEKQLEITEKQISTLRSQIHQARTERDALDEQLPRGGGPLTVRLQAAERRLADLEASLPTGSTRGRRAERPQHAEMDFDELQAEEDAPEADRRRRRLTDDERESIRVRAKETHRRLAELRREWLAALAEAGLPTDLTSHQFLDTAHRYLPVKQHTVRPDDAWRRDDELRRRELQRRLDQRKLDRDHAQHHVRVARDRVQHLLADVGLSFPGASSEEQLHRLRQHVREQQSLASRRKRNVAQAARIRRACQKHEKALRQLRKRQRGMLRRADALNEEEFRRIAARAGELKRLRQRREIVERELAAARAGHCSEEELRQLLADEGGRSVEARWEECSTRLQAIDSRLRAGHERRSQLVQSLTALAGDRRPAALKLDLNAVEERLRAACEQWQVLAATQYTLQSVRQHYERERQPETLREATGYLERLTLGRYTRIWTPLDEDALYVDNSAGQGLSVESLSRGTREQVFLSLRLALASAYARRGAAMPLILDDVLVNFDDERAKATANLLVEYADSGRQMFVFTCHEHIMRLFKARKAPIIRLPSRTATNERATPEVEIVSVRKKPRKEAIVEPVVVAEPVEMAPREVVIEPLPIAAELMAPSHPAPPRAPAPVIVLPFADIHHSQPSVPAPHFVQQPAIEPRWLHDPLEAPVDPDAELVIDDAWQKALETRYEHDPREAPADPDEDLATDDDYLRRLRERVFLPRPATEPNPETMAPPPEPRIVRRVIRRRWRPFTGEGAEEFAGEFAVRPAPGRWEEWEETEDGRQVPLGQDLLSDANGHGAWTVAPEQRETSVESDAAAASLHIPRNFDAHESEGVWTSQSPLLRWERVGS